MGRKLVFNSDDEDPAPGEETTDQGQPRKAQQNPAVEPVAKRTRSRSEVESDEDTPLAVSNKAAEAEFSSLAGAIDAVEAPTQRKRARKRDRSREAAYVDAKEKQAAEARGAAELSEELLEQVLEAQREHIERSKAAKAKPANVKVKGRKRSKAKATHLRLDDGLEVRVAPRGRDASSALVGKGEAVDFMAERLLRSGRIKRMDANRFVSQRRSGSAAIDFAKVPQTGTKSKARRRKR
mmetsp:Transcript_6932/g.26737  ORF Transcript_6932/g.26737 Transcript_6932/m.26737 type:complete len:238 (-) Transcript_6932:33-746(-)|eukprot:scaffold1505_cov256-Pinguiococcus_pyrenoidosus.AAC.14